MAAKSTGALCRRDNSFAFRFLRPGAARGSPTEADQVPVDRSQPDGGWAAAAESLKERLGGFNGRLCAGLDAADLLLRVVELPATDPAELTAMVALQVDRFSPFPAERQAAGFEVLCRAESSTRVLIAAARRELIDAVGDAFRQARRIPDRIDLELLGWWRELDAGFHEPADGRHVLLRREEGRSELIVLEKGAPILLRALDPEAEGDGLAREVAFSLAALETEWGPAAARVTAWGAAPADLDSLRRAGLPAETPPEPGPDAAAGLARRLQDDTGLNLVPAEWKEAEALRRTRRGLIKASAALLGTWLALLLVFGSAFSLQQSRLARLEAETLRWEHASARVRELQEKVRSLERYADRSRSALESLREVARLLPAGVELNAFTYRKAEQVALRGEADSEAPIYDFLRSLEQSPFFTGVETEGLTSRAREGRNRTEFRVSLKLPGSS